MSCKNNLFQCCFANLRSNSWIHFQVFLACAIIASIFSSSIAYPKPQEERSKEDAAEELQEAAAEETATAPADGEKNTSKFEGSQLALALKLSGAKPQPVSASSYGGRKKRTPQDAAEEPQEVAVEELQEAAAEEPATAPADGDKATSKFGGSQLALALELSGAKPQAVSASSYGGRKRRSPQDATEEPQEAAAEEPTVAEEPTAAPADGEKTTSKFGGSQLALALELSGAKPQPVSASSYGGRK